MARTPQKVQKYPTASPDLIEVMDTTLRDGEQTPDISYTPAEKLQLARLLLEDVNVDRLEIASSRVSEGEKEAAVKIASWARRTGFLNRIEILGYCDGKSSVDWIHGVGGRVLNLLTKGSEEHCRLQLRMTPEKHRAKIEETISYAAKKRVIVNVYLEDWSNGVKNSFDYVFLVMKSLVELPVKRVYLPDTLGIQDPISVHQFVGLMKSTWPQIHFEYHGHNDYGLSTANCLAAVRAGARGIHTSVNGMGERAGNCKLVEAVAAIHDHTNFKTSIREERLVAASRIVETFCGKEVSANAPIVGRDVFTQTAGIHADGDAKGDLYASPLLPKRFGRQRRYALGKLSGKASLDQNLSHLGIDLSSDIREVVLQRIIELGDKKHTVVPEDLRFIIADILKTPEEQLVRVSHYDVRVQANSSPQATVTIAFKGRESTGKAKGDGGYDAFMNAMKKAVRSFKISVPRLEDFRVRIPPGGRTHALVETVITWAGESSEEGNLVTQGVDSDQLAAAVIATEKMLNARVARTKSKPIKRKKGR